MSEIAVDYPLMRDKTEKILEIYRKLTREISRMTDYTKDLDIFWDGDANTAYMASIGRDIAQAGVILMKLRSTVLLAGEAFKLYMSNEKEVRRLISSYIH